jgi:hypothetical protein
VYILLSRSLFPDRYAMCYPSSPREKEEKKIQKGPKRPRSEQLMAVADDDLG